MEQVLMSIWMDLIMKDSGSKIISMDLEKNIGQKKLNLKEIIFMEKKKDLVFIFGMISQNIEDT